MPLFDKEQWSWRRADTEEDYYGMSNCVRVDDRRVPVAIPTGLFLLMHTLDVKSIQGAYLSMNYVDSHWQFGYNIEEVFVPLWIYRKIPAWLN